MAVELATAYVSVIPTVRNLRENLERQFAPVPGIAAEHGRRAGHGFANAFENATSKVGDRLGSALKIGVAAAGAGVAAAGVIGIKTAAQMETANIGFTTMLGSGEKAAAFLKNLQDFAAKTPFAFPELQTAASSLISIGIDADKVIPIMTSLGNATAGMGTGSEGVKRATVALQQMNAAGRISAQDLNQLRDAGIPVFELLTKATGKTTAELADMAANGKLGRTELDQLMSALESGKGLERFNGLMDKQSQSLSGLASTFKDTFTVGLAKAVEPAIPLLKQGLGGTSALLADTILPKVTSGLAAAVGGITAFGAAWKANDGDITSSGFAGFMERLAGFIHSAFDGTKAVVSGFFDAFKTGQANLQGGALLAIISTLGASAAQVFQTLAPVIKSAFDTLAPVIGPLIPQILELVTALSPVHILFDALIGILPDVVKLVGDLAADFGNVLSGALDAVMPLVKGFADFLQNTVIPALKGFTGFLADNREVVVIAAIAFGAYVLAVQGLSIFNTVKGWLAAAQAAQWGLNAAMSANPIGLIIAGIAALVAGLVWFFTQTELGRDIVKNVWAFIQAVIEGFVKWFTDNVLPVISAIVTGVGKVFTWLWENVIQPVFGFIGAYIGAWFEVLRFIFNAVVAVIQKILVPVIVWLWENVFKPVFGFIGELIGFWWNNIVLPVLTAVWKFISETLGPVFKWLWETIIKPAFEGIGKTIDWVWQNVIKPVFDTLSKFIGETIPNAFTSGVKIIGDIWQGLQDIVKKPIKFVIETVLNDGLIGAFNNVAHFLGIPELPKIALPPGFAAGGWTGPGGMYQPAGIVHADEHVIRAVSRRSMEASFPGLLDYINEHGTMPGYARGGLVNPVPGAWVSQWFTPTHNGLDLAAPLGTPVLAAADGTVSQATWSPFGGGNEIHIDHPTGLQTWYAHLLDFAVKLGQVVSAGQQVGWVDTTGLATGPHLHFMVLNGGWPNVLDPTPYLTELGGELPEDPHKQGAPFNPVSAVIDFLVGQFKSAFPQGGAFIDLVGGVAKNILQAAADFIGGIFGGHHDQSAHGSTAGALVFDGGGWLENTGGARLVVHNARQPDAVLTHGQWDTMTRIAAGAEKAGTEINFNGPVYGNPQHIVDEIEAAKRREAIYANLTAITVGG